MFKIDTSYIIILFFVLFVIYKYLCIKYEAFESYEPFEAYYATPTRPYCDDKGYEPLASGNPYNELENELVGSNARANQLFVADKRGLDNHLRFFTPEEKLELEVESEAERIKEYHEETNTPYTFLEKKLFYDGIYDVKMGPMGTRTYTLYKPGELKNYVELKTDKYFHIPEIMMKPGEELIGEKQNCCQGINLTQ